MSINKEDYVYIMSIDRKELYDFCTANNIEKHRARIVDRMDCIVGIHGEHATVHILRSAHKMCNYKKLLDVLTFSRWTIIEVES